MKSTGTDWIAVIEGIIPTGSDEGRRLIPGIIFTGAELQRTWFPADIDRIPENLAVTTKTSR